MQVAANLLHTLVRRSSLIISIYRNHVHRRITRNRQRHRTGQLWRIALHCAIRILHLILVIGHRCCIHEHHIVVRIIRILDRYFLACRFCCTNSKGMTGIKFNTAAGLNQRCNIFKARHDIKTKRTGCCYCYIMILTVSDSGLRVSDITVIHLRKMRRRLQNRHYLRIGVAGADAFDLREHGIVVYICRCKRQIAVALVIVCPVILPAAERAVRRNRCLTARGARTRFFIKLTNLQKLLVEGLLLAVLNVVYLFHALLVAVKIADGIVQNTAVVDETAAQPAVMALIRAFQDRQPLIAVHRANLIHTAGNEQIFLGVDAVRRNSRYRDRILHIVTLGAGIGKAVGDNFCRLEFLCPRIIFRAVLIAVCQQSALIKLAVLIIILLIVVAYRNNFRRHTAARRIADIADGHACKTGTAACAVILVQQLFVQLLIPTVLVVVVVDRQIGFLVVGMTVIRFLLQVVDVDRHCQLLDTVHIHVADFHINAQMRTQLVIAVAVVVQHCFQRVSAAVNDVTEVDYPTLVSQCVAAERILLNAVYSSRILVVARRVDHQGILAVAVKVACGQTQHSTGLIEFQVLDVFAVATANILNIRHLAVLVGDIQLEPLCALIEHQIRNVLILAGAVRVKCHSRNALGIADIRRVAPPKRRHLIALSVSVGYALGCALVCRLELIRVHAGYNQLVVLEQRNPSQRAVWVITKCGFVCHARFFFRGQTKAVSCCCSIRSRRLRQHDLRQQTCQHTAYQQQTANSFFHFSSSLPYEINGFHGFPLALLRRTVRGYRYFTVLSV